MREECRPLSGLWGEKESIRIHGFAPVARGVSPLSGLRTLEPTVQLPESRLPAATRPKKFWKLFLRA
jgi:hypothetical protein